MMSDDIIMRNIALGGENDGLCVREVKVVQLWGRGGLQDTLKYGDFAPKNVCFSGKKRFSRHFSNISGNKVFV